MKQSSNKRMHTIDDHKILRLSDYERQMKKFETLCDALILPDLFLVVRIDAHRLDRNRYWSTYPEEQYPISESFMGYLTDTVKFLFSLEYEFSLAYIAGDEISLLLNINQRKNERRTAKIVSQVASAASAGFFLTCGLPVSFCAKLAQLPTQEHVIDYFVWQKMVAERNFYARLVGLHFQHHHLDSKELTILLAKGVDALKEFADKEVKQISKMPSKLKDGLLLTSSNEIKIESTDTTEKINKYQETLSRTLKMLDSDKVEKNFEIRKRSPSTKQLTVAKSNQLDNTLRLKTSSKNFYKYGKRKPAP